MKKLIVAIVAGFMSMAVAGAYAADDMKKDGMSKGDMKKDGMSKGDMKKSDKGMAKSDKGMSKDDMSKDDMKKGKGKKDDKK